MVYNAPIVRSEVVETSFGFYTNDQIRQLSVCQLTSPVSQDSLGNNLQGGLYDARLGCTEPGLSCQTCGQNYINCPGHFGHIELDVLAYHPMLFSNMLSLLKTKCAYCHKFRLKPDKCFHTLIKLQLLEMGEVTNALELDDLVGPTQLNDDKSESRINDINNQLRIYQERFKAFISMPNRRRVDPHHKTLQSNIIEAFIKACTACKKCENCGGISPGYRKDGFSKIFQKPLPKKAVKPMKLMKLEIKSGLEALEGEDPSKMDEDDSDDDHDDEFLHEDTPSDADKYLVPVEVEAQIKLLWRQHPEFLNFVWSRAVYNDCSAELKDGWEIFFMKCVLVPPSRFRPASKVGNAISEHPQTVNLAKIIDGNEKVRTIQLESMSKVKTDESINTVSELSKLVTNWINLQNAVNCFMDSAKDPNILANQAGPPGIRQILERKEGLFRKNMMGKRVNYCCRSVISPDPYLGVNEIGIPVKFAKTLHYPTPVNDWNVKYLRTLVERGPFEYPGANQIETPDGKIIKLEKLSLQERIAKGKLLLSTPGMKVYRHVVDGDVLLVNRQPTLHKPGIMAHKARILKHVREQTLRMHYANCNAYNADFDGDEINCHFVQSELARAEANYICNTNNQYIVPTSGNPLRGLIQDHVASAVKLSCKDTFLSRQEFQQILFIAICGLPGTEVVESNDMIIMPPPVILKPQPRWTGKQVFSSLISHICKAPLPSLNLDSKTRTPPTTFGIEEQEHIVIIRQGELLTGLMDKVAIGNASLGLVHAIYELYGADKAGLLLSSLGRMLTFCLQESGHTCGIEDLTLTMSADKERNKLLDVVDVEAAKGLNDFFSSDSTSKSKKQRSSKELQKCIAKLLDTDRVNGKVAIDSTMQGSVNKSASQVIKACLPNGLERPFLKNNFTIMVSTGAKGSGVNQSQITCFLGQQALEGQRVPLMVSGKSLPSFRAHDASPRAGGFVRDRFLTGVKPQEYYFHCMAGREGLVDTAVKTSRSGYLQRCLMKHLEDLRIHYDMTVRDSGYNIVQFLYGEDGIDPMNSCLLRGDNSALNFMARNNQALVHQFEMNADYFSRGLDLSNSQHHLAVAQSLKSLTPSKPLTSVSDIVQHLEKKLAVGSFIYCKRKIISKKSWKPKNIMPKEFVVEIKAIRRTNDGKVYDVQYPDGQIEKDVPIAVQVSSASGEPNVRLGHVRARSSVTSSRVWFALMNVKEADPIMSALSLGSNVGCISEKMQSAVSKYVDTNPEKILADASSSGLAKESFELLVWVKYMKSLACPGEAVGCVAAQSIGEPSTQMTLNTFHLAGHGGANVTLGIPRLREIIMTASKTPKTPTMLLPINPIVHKTKAISTVVAKDLARRLSRLPLHILLNHESGVEIGERIVLGVNGLWQRIYRVSLRFANLAQIEATFHLTFPEILDAIKVLFLAKLKYNIQLEQRRAGDKVTVTSSKIRNDEFEGRGRSGENEDGDEEDTGKNNKKDDDVLGKLLDDSDSDNELDNDSDEEKGPATTDDSDGESESDDELVTTTAVKASKDKKSDDEDDQTDDAEEEDSDADDNVDVATLMKKAVAKTQKSPKKGKKKVTAVKKRAVGAMNIVKDGSFTCDESAGVIEFEMSFPASARRLLMLQLVEKATKSTTVRATKSIANAYYLPYELKTPEKKEISAVQTEGVNFEAAWNLSENLVMHNEIMSNDVYSLMLTYGIEAARQSIVREINGVFEVYGIDVNPRHLSLIADFMTRTGSYHAMNRMGMNQNSSPLLQMSFETTCNFLLKSAIEGRYDNQESASARIVLGSVPRIGTGCFDVMVPIQDGENEMSTD